MFVGIWFSKPLFSLFLLWTSLSCLWPIPPTNSILQLIPDCSWGEQISSPAPPELFCLTLPFINKLHIVICLFFFSCNSFTLGSISCHCNLDILFCSTALGLKFFLLVLCVWGFPLRSKGGSLYLAVLTFILLIFDCFFTLLRTSCWAL